MHELTEQFKRGNSEEVCQIAHALKGMCREISANKLRELLSDVELKAATDSLDIGPELEAIELMISKVVKDINRNA